MITGQRCSAGKRGTETTAAIKEKSEDWTCCDVMRCAGDVGLFLIASFRQCGWNLGRSESLDGYIFIYEFDKDGGFSSSFKEKGSDFLVPGGIGQYEIEGDSLHITMSTGEEKQISFR